MRQHRPICYLAVVMLALSWNAVRSQQQGTAPPPPSAAPDGTDLPPAQILKDLRTAQETYRAKHGSYGDLNALKAAGLSLVGEGGTDAVCRYRFLSVVGPEGYTVVAIPPPQGPTMAFTLMVSSELRSHEADEARAILHRARVRKQENAAIGMFRLVRNVQEAYRSKRKSYGTLDALRAAGLVQVGDGQIEPVSAYRFRCVAEKDRYTITAVPPEKGMRQYQMDETGTIKP